MAYGYAKVWVRNEFKEGNGTVERVDPTSREVTAAIPVGSAAGPDGLDSLAALDDGLWVAGLQLERIDSTTNRVVRRINHTCGAGTAGAGAWWTVDLAYAVSWITP